MPETNRITKGRILSGMRPTGKLHLGNYVGALRNWVGLQDNYECFFFIADWHALTTDYADTRSVKQNSLEVMLDYLAAGLDPERSTLFIQSHVPQHAELHLLFSMITPLSWLERVPSYKEQRENLKDKDLGTYGFLGYPLLQSADILIYSPCPERLLPNANCLSPWARIRCPTWSLRVKWRGGLTSFIRALVVSDGGRAPPKTLPAESRKKLRTLLIPSGGGSRHHNFLWTTCGHAKARTTSFFLSRSHC